MDADAAFAEIRNEIAQGRGAEVGPRLLEIAESDKDPMNRIKCLSLLKVIDVSGVSKEILRMLLEDLPDDRATLVQVAGALRGLEYPSSALSILRRWIRTIPSSGCPPCALSTWRSTRTPWPRPIR